MLSTDLALQTVFNQGFYLISLSGIASEPVPPVRAHMLTTNAGNPLTTNDGHPLTDNGQ